MEKEQNEALLKEFSPQFLANGIVGMFNSGEYESVEIKITFNKKRIENNITVANTPSTTKT